MKQPAFAPYELPAGFVQGSRWLRYEDLFQGTDPAAWLFQAPDYGIEGGEPGQDVPGFLGDLIGRLAPHGGKGPRVVVVGRPDIGKTALAYALMRQVNQLRTVQHRDGAMSKAPPAMVVPLGRYMRDYQQWPAYVGTRLWMRSRGPTASLPARPGKQPLLLLDSLDDLVRHQAPAGLADLLERPLFTDAALLTCSDALYEEIQAAEAVRTACLVTLEGLGVAQRLRFGRRYVAAVPLVPSPSSTTADLATERATLSKDVERAIRRDADGGRTFQEPLHLLIQLDTLWQSEGPRMPQLDHYVSSTLEYEVTSGGRRLPLAQILEVLGRLAALLAPSGEGPLSSEGIDALTTAGYADFLRDCGRRLDLSTGEVISELAHCRFVRLRTGSLEMRSRQFRDYFLAHDIILDLLSSAPRTPISARFSHLLPGSVVVHLLDELGCVQRSEELRARARDRLWKELEDAARAMAEFQGPTRRTADPRTIRQRIVCEQLSYYLAVLIGPGSESDALRQLVGSRSALEDDPWIRRGVVVGLGLGGKQDVIASYVEELWAERLAHDASCSPGAPCTAGANRQVNVEFNTVLFGDAAPLNGLPDRCRRPVDCQQTLAGMLELLETYTNLELCRLLLFIVFDLHSYHWDGDPQQNLRDRWCSAFAPGDEGDRATQGDGTGIRWTLRDRLEDVLDRLQDQRIEWPETVALRQLLSEMPAAAGRADLPRAAATGSQGGGDAAAGVP